MRANLLLIFTIWITFIACKETKSLASKEFTRYIQNDYELVVAPEQKGLLVLFPCLYCDIENTKTEFNIEKKSLAKGISILYMNDNMRLFLNQKEKLHLAEKTTQIIRKHKLKEDNIYIGGFSAGGNISLLLTNYMVQSQEWIHAKGVFIVDSPIDLLALNLVAEKNITLNAAKSSVQEANWIKNHFDEEFGSLPESLPNYLRYSPYVHQEESIRNLEHLDGLKIRMYTEPDTIWWYNKNRNEYEDTNAFYIKNISSST